MSDLSITEFLLARIAEDEQVARAAQSPRGATIFTDPRRGGKQSMLDHIARHDPARVLAECQAKRRIVAPWVGTVTENEARVLLALAAVYADHPDYSEEWRP